MVVEVEVVRMLVRHHNLMVLVAKVVAVPEMVEQVEMELQELQIQAVAEVVPVRQTQLYHQVLVVVVWLF
tara:strand:- start:123 stop:332 length:210 start_codon:yes stop_codon:yes gene_type:complete